MYVSEVKRSWPVSDIRLDEIRKATDEDSVIREAMKFRVNSSPSKSNGIPRDLRGLYSVRSNFYVVGRALGV